MADVGPSLFRFDNSFVRDLPELWQASRAAHAPEPELLVLNEELAVELGVDPERLRTPEGVGVLVGNVISDGAEPVAQAYAGHQFGGLSPRLGDGRALLIGEVIGPDGRRRDLHLKGSGRTPFSRGGDGLAAVGPMLREHLVGEAMHALGIPTTRSLGVVATGQGVRRETLLPGAVLARTAASHLRVGTFQFAAMSSDDGLVGRLADHAIGRHHPELAAHDQPYRALFEAVVDAQAALVARWMHVGFIHGVMNTDNTTISGETIDYGPCAFLDTYDPATVFSSIDHGGRYAFGQQPSILQWNLARLAEAMLPLLDPDTDAAVEWAMGVLNAYPDRFRLHWTEGMRAKLGIEADKPDDTELIDDLLRLLDQHGADLTISMRSLSALATGDESAFRAALGSDAGADAPAGSVDAWIERYVARLAVEGRDPADVAAGMDQVNPIYIPRNHLVEEALDAATAGDMEPFDALLAVVTEPFEARPGLERYAQAPTSMVGYQTFCGT